MQRLRINMIILSISETTVTTDTGANKRQRVVAGELLWEKGCQHPQTGSLRKSTA
jgi:hypothetical protein